MAKGTKERLRKVRRAAGVCTECGGERDAPKVLRCAECRDKRRERMSAVWLVPQAKDPRFRPSATSAFARGIKWTLTEEQFTAARDLPCHYCGAEPSPTGCGLDRQDPDLGYEPGNVVPCCQMCNCAKSVLTGDEWSRIISPAVALLGRGNVWPTQSRFPSEEKRAERAAVAMAWPFCTMVATMGLWASAALEKRKLELAAQERQRLGLDDYGRTPEQAEHERTLRLEAAEANRKAYIKDHLAKGLCIACSRPAIEGRRHCQEHDRYGRDYHAATYVATKNQCGLCGAKGHNARRCPERATLSEEDKRTWAMETRNTRERAWQQARAEQRRAQGLCYRCGERPHLDGLSECAECKRPETPKHSRSCWACGASFETTVNSLEKVCGSVCRKAVVAWRSDRKSFKNLGDHWPRWKKEMWLRLHPEHPEHATYCIQVTDASARDSA